MTTDEHIKSLRKLEHQALGNLDDLHALRDAGQLPNADFEIKACENWLEDIRQAIKKLTLRKLRS